MALTIEQMQTLLRALNGPSFDYHPTSIMADAVHALEAELHRLTHGPFTLAEAVASGRPFRRKGQPIWVKPSPSTEEGPSWLHQRGGGDWEPYLVDTATGWLEEANEFSADDITATDYELQPLDKQNT